MKIKIQFNKTIKYKNHEKSKRSKGRISYSSYRQAIFRAKQDQQKNKDKKQDQQQKDQQKNDQQKQKEKEEDKNNQQQDPPKQDKQDDKNESKPKPMPSKLTKEQADQLLNALNEEEKKLREKKEKSNGQPVKLDKDW